MKKIIYLAVFAVLAGLTGCNHFRKEDLKVTVKPAAGHKCERCWVYSDTVGQDPEHPTLCTRCAAVVK